MSLGRELWDQPQKKKVPKEGLGTRNPPQKPYPSPYQKRKPSTPEALKPTSQGLGFRVARKSQSPKYPKPKAADLKAQVREPLTLNLKKA